MFTLPIAQYPEIAPPTVTVSATYPGANAETVAKTVATPIEEQVNGVENMLYMSSQSTNTGNLNLTVTFKVGTNLDVAQVQVQNRVAIALPQLPPEVQQQGVTVKKASPDITLAIAFYSPDGSHDALFISNYVTLEVKDQIARLPGVGDIDDLRRARLFDAAVARSRQAGGAKHDRGRRRQRGQRAERPGGGGNRRRAAAPQAERRFPIHGECAGPAHRSGRVRRHRRQGGQRRPHHPAEGRGPRRAGRRRLQHHQLITTGIRPSRWPSSSCRAPTRSALPT